MEAALAKADTLILNSKFFTKLLVCPQEFLPFVRLVYDLLTKPYTKLMLVDGLRNEFSDVVVFCMTSIPFENMTRQFCLQIQNLVKEHLDDSEYLLTLSSVVKVGVERLLLSEQPVDALLAWNNKSILSSNNFGYRIFGALLSTIPSGNDSAKMILLDYSLVANHELVLDAVGNDAWIRLCIKADVDPKSLIETESPALLKGICEDSQAVSASRLTVTSLFTAIAPATSFQALMPWICAKLDSDFVAGVTMEEMQIYETPEGQVCFDPNGKKPVAAGPSASSKKTASSKQIKSEKEALRNQIEKEASIRNRVRCIVREVSKALDLLNAVISGLEIPFASGFENDFGVWLNLLLQKLVWEVFPREQTGGVKLVGSRGIDVFIRLCSLFASHLGDVVGKSEIQSCILRIIGLTHHEGLHKHLFSPSIFGFTCFPNVLESIKLTLDKVSETKLPLTPFLIVFCLCRLVVAREYQLKSLKLSQIAELSISASDFLFSHASLSDQAGFPAKEYAECCLDLIEKYPKLHGKAIRSLSRFCESCSNTKEADSVLKVLLDGVLRKEPVLRAACLRCLSVFEVSESLPSYCVLPLLIAEQDSEADIKNEASRIWKDWDGEKKVSADIIPEILTLLCM